MRWNELPDALGLHGREVVSFVGGGGKTTALFALAAHRPGRTIVTTTTKMGRDRVGPLPVLVGPTDAEIIDTLGADGSVIVWSGVDEQRAIGVEPADCSRFSGLAETVAVEADGSRRRPFKAPLHYEPVVPAATTTLVACCGMAAVGAPIIDGCHRPEQVAALTGASVHQRLTPERLVQVLLSPDGSMKERPDGAGFAVLLNRVRPTQSALVAEIRERVLAVDPSVSVLAVEDLEPTQLPDHAG